MFDSRVESALIIPIRLEDSGETGVTGKTNANITVRKSDPSDADWVTVGTGDRSLNELSEGDYTLTINKNIIDEKGFLRVKVSCDGAVTKQYVVNILPRPTNLYFKSGGSDSTGDGSKENPFETLEKCLTESGTAADAIIHCMNTPANVAGNKDQLVSQPVTIKGHGYSWGAVVPTSYNIQIPTTGEGVILEDFRNIKIDLDPDAVNIQMRNCYNVTFPSRGFSKDSIYEDCHFSTAITGSGTNFGDKSKWNRCIFKENVTVAVTWSGGIMNDCVFEKDFNSGVADNIVFNNLKVGGNYTAPFTAANGKVTFRNPHITGNVSIDIVKYVFMGGVVRGSLTLGSNSADCIFWNTRIKGSIADTGTGNEVLNESELALETTAQAIKTKTDNLPADPASESNVSAVGAAVVVVDGVVDAIKVQTDKLTFNAANRILSDLREVNDADITLADLAGLTRDQYVDFFNKEVLSRDGEEPGQYKLGTAGNAKTIDVDFVVIGSKKKADKETVL